MLKYTKKGRWKACPIERGEEKSGIAKVHAIPLKTIHNCIDCSEKPCRNKILHTVDVLSCAKRPYYMKGFCEAEVHAKHVI